MPDETIYIWIEDATDEYKRSRAWLDEQVRHGKLRYAKFEGDRKTYLYRAELDALLGKPKPDAQRQPRNRREENGA